MSDEEDPPRPEVMTKPVPLTDDELDELERLANEATMRPWQAVVEPLELSEAGVKQGLKYPTTETTIHTVWHQGQLKGPGPVITTTSGPFYKVRRSIHMREQDANFIVAACNAMRRLLIEVRAARGQKKEEEDGEDS